MRPRIVLFIDPARTTARLVPALHAHVGEVVAIVARGRRLNLRTKLRARARSAPEWSFRAQFRAAGIDPPLISGDMLDDPAALRQALSALSPDLLVCAMYSRRIPAEVLSLFPSGAVNLHPARLPNRPGPQPIHAMIAEDAFREDGTVTLHVMDPGLDTGPVIAHADLAQGAWENLQVYQAALGGAFEALAGAPLADWLAGRRMAVAQDPGIERRWAGMLRAPVAVAPDWTLSRLSRAWAFIGTSPGLAVDGPTGPVPILGKPQRVSPPTGAPVDLDGQVVTFDIADARVTAIPGGWGARNRAKAERRRIWRGLTPVPPDRITYADSPETSPGNSDTSPDNSR